MLNKKQFKLMIPIIIAVIVFGVLIVYVLINTGSKTPLTCGQFDSIAKELGYETTDTSSEYSNLGDTLVASRKIISDDFRFEYLEFNDSSSAKALYGSMYTKIIGKRSQHDVEYSDYYSNYRHYALESNGKYYSIIYVGNTASYAECDATYKNDVLDILTEMDYRPDKKEAIKNRQGT